MNVFLAADSGPLATAIAEQLARDGHTVDSPGGVAGNGRPARRKPLRRAAWKSKLMAARALVYVSRPAGRSAPAAFRARVRACLAPLASLLDSAAESGPRIQRLVLVSDASLYGEGSYTCPVNGAVTPQWRRANDLEASRWDHCCPICGEPLVPLPTPETHPPAPLSATGIFMYAQERLATRWALEHGISTVALRYFRLYGGAVPRGNRDPLDYGGAAGTPARVLRKAAAGSTIELDEDGGQTRDFVHVEDVARATSLALRAPVEDLLVLNVGSGVATSATALVEAMGQALGRPLAARATGRFDAEEPRHLFANVSELARLGFRLRYDLNRGLQHLASRLAVRVSS